MKNLLSFSIAILLSIQAWGQETSKITPSLRAHLQQVSDTTLVPILIVFKNTRTWTKAELRALDKMSRSERQNYVVWEIKAVADVEFAPVLTKFRAAEQAQQVARIRPLSAAGAIGCKATKNAIAMIEHIPNISYIKWDKPVPIEEIIDSPTTRAKNAIPAQPFPQSTHEIQWPLNKINVPKVWDLGFTGAGVLVAIFDTGTDYNHNDLKDHLWDGSNFSYTFEDQSFQLVNHGWDTVDDDNDPKNVSSSHGTNVASLFVGDGTNGKATGVAKDATLMILRSVAGAGGEASMMDGFQ